MYSFLYICLKDRPSYYHHLEICKYCSIPNTVANHFTWMCEQGETSKIKVTHHMRRMVKYWDAPAVIPM